MSLLRHKSPTNQACTARRLAGGDLHSLGAGWCYFTPLRHHPTTKKKKKKYRHTHIPSLPPPPSPPPFALQIFPPFTAGLELRTLDRRIAATENPKRSIAGGGVQSSATKRTPPPPFRIKAVSCRRSVAASSVTAVYSPRGGGSSASSAFALYFIHKFSIFFSTNNLNSLQRMISPRER